jgi:hypothetical protein
MMDALTSEKWPLHASEYNTFFYNLQVSSLSLSEFIFYFLLIKHYADS